MLVKLQIGEASQKFTDAVKTLRGARKRDLILVAGGAADPADTWGVLITPLSHEKVCDRLAKQLYESNCNFTGEDFIERFNRALRGDQ